LEFSVRGVGVSNVVRELVSLVIMCLFGSKVRLISCWSSVRVWICLWW